MKFWRRSDVTWKRRDTPHSGRKGSTMRRTRYVSLPQMLSPIDKSVGLHAVNTHEDHIIFKVDNPQISLIKPQSLSRPEIDPVQECTSNPCQWPFSHRIYYSQNRSSWA